MKARFARASKLLTDLCKARERFNCKWGACGNVPLGVSGACWLWAGATKQPSKRPRSSGGLELPYGKFWFRGRTIPAHVFAFALEHSRDPESLGLISHECDNPLCVRPSHLKESSHSKNQKDAYARGRKRVTTPRTLCLPGECREPNELTRLLRDLYGPELAPRISLAAVPMRSVQRPAYHELGAVRHRLCAQDVEQCRAA
jgi:hypothetical protein